MSRENVDAVRRIYAEWARGDMTAGVDLFDARIRFESFMPDASERVVVKGPERIEAHMREFLAQWRDFRIVGEEFREVGDDRVFVAGRQTATGRDSGIAVADALYAVWTLRAGRVVRLLFDRDRDRTLEATGLTERAMAPENVEVVRSMYAAFSPLAQGGDVAAYVAEHWDPECEYDPIEETGILRGREQLIGWHERWFEAWDEFRAEVDEIAEVGGALVAAITIHGRGAGSSVEITQRLFHVCEVRDGKLLRMREYSDRREALEAAGSPQ